MPVRRNGKADDHGDRREAGVKLIVRALVVGAIALVVLVGTLLIAGKGAQSTAERSADNRPERVRERPNGVPPVTRANLRVNWKDRAGSTLSAPWMRGGLQTLRGTLSTLAGGAIRRARVTVLAADGARPRSPGRRVGQLRTDRKGRFEANIRVDRGSARKLLTFTFSPQRDSKPLARTQAKLKVYAPLSLQAKQGKVARGGKVRLGGKTAPSEPARVLLKEPGDTEWRELTSARADSKGRWSATVRITKDSARGKYAFQARAPANARLGYLAARSDPATVRIK